MMLKYLSQKTILLVIMAAVFIIISIVCVDKPLVLFLQEYGICHARILHYMQVIPKILVISLLLAVLWRTFHWYRNANSPVDRYLLVTSSSLIIALCANSLLKFVFGRSLPKVLFDEQVAMIPYGFHFFRWESVYRSFPSGHTAVMFAVSTVLWEYFPQRQWLVMLLCPLVMIGLIGCAYQFVSDVLAGAGVGIMAGRTVLVWYTASFRDIAQSSQQP